MLKNEKNILRYIAFYAKCGEANVTPPLGPMLGQFPIDVKLFCNRFNNETQNYSKGVLVRVFLILYTDNTYEYKIKTPPINFLLDLSSKLLKLSYSRKKQKKKLYIINKTIYNKCNYK